MGSINTKCRSEYILLLLEPTIPGEIMQVPTISHLAPCAGVLVPFLYQTFTNAKFVHTHESLRRLSYFHSAQHPFRTATTLKDQTHDATLSVILRAMAELYRVSIFAIVACNVARNVAGVEASSTSTTFHATIALRVCLLQHCTQWCDVRKSF